MFRFWSRRVGLRWGGGWGWWSRWIRTWGWLWLLPGLVLVVRVLFLMQDSQSFSFFDEGLLSLLGQKFPPASKLLGNFSIVFVWSHFNDFATFQLRPDHKGIHRTLDVIWWMLLSLKREKKIKLERVICGKLKYFTFVGYWTCILTCFLSNLHACYFQVHM